jgi:putative methyltransferase (TIGR04325 family)
MRWKASAKSLLPPIVVDAFRRLSPTPPPAWEYAPGGWRPDDDPHIRGWNVESVLDVYRAKWPEFVDLVQGTGPLGIAHEASAMTNTSAPAHNTLMSFAYVLALTAQHRDSLSMLDWGGGIGHYCLISQALLADTTLDYHCKDVPLLADYGRSILPQARFYHDDSCLSRTYDLVLASGSLQYSHDWRATLQKLARAASPYLYVTRLPVVRQHPSFVVIQRPHRFGYDTEYQGWFINHQELLQAAEAAGLTLLREFLIQEKPSVAGAPEQGLYRGFLFRAAP